jgi:hypothetical protein
MDLSRIVEQDSADYELLHPTERTPLGVIFILAGPEHEKRKAIVINFARDLRKRIGRTGKFMLEDPAGDEDRETDYLVAATLGWKDLEVEGKPLPYSPDAARTLYSTPRFAWIRRQIKQALEDQENFIASSSAA